MRWIVVAFGLVFGCVAGCNGLPEGTQFQSSTFGMRVAPLSPDGAPFVLGSHTAIINTPAPADAGPSLNRSETNAPGINLKSTVGSGPVGEQIDQAGGPAALQHPMNPDISTQLPTPLSPDLVEALRERRQSDLPQPLNSELETRPPSPFE